jgi:hypothetical protein
LKRALHRPEQQLVSLTQLCPLALQTLTGRSQMPVDEGTQTVALALRSMQQSSRAPQSASLEQVRRHAPVEANTPSEVPLGVTVSAQYKDVPAQMGAVLGHGWPTPLDPPALPPPAAPPPAAPPPAPPFKHEARLVYRLRHAVAEPRSPFTQEVAVGLATRQSSQAVAGVAQAEPRSIWHCPATVDAAAPHFV